MADPENIFVNMQPKMEGSLPLVCILSVTHRLMNIDNVLQTWREDRKRKRAMHKPIRAFLIAFALCCYLFTIFINIISSNLGLELDWFANSIGNTTAQFQFDFTPAGWVFTLWAVIFFWNLIWHLYALTTICRR
uniref:Uncharacterized protein n=1 Tax=Branchiostoma floridae TaxID=7739 RepID=C3YT36_BRAFL|eukprot:XP_002600391.1 hypothetical protein BRAFLDRAFT_99583 [Branchiostoma floridae]